MLSAPILWGTAPAAIPSCSEPPHVPQRRAESRAPCRAASSAALRGHRQPPPHRRAALLPGVGLRPWVPLLLLSSAVLWGRPPPVLPLLLLCAAVSRQRVPWRWNSPPPVILHVSLCRRVWSSPGLPQLLVPEQGLVLSSSARGCRCEFGSSLEGRGGEPLLGAAGAHSYTPAQLHGDETGTCSTWEAELACAHGAGTVGRCDPNLCPLRMAALTPPGGWSRVPFLRQESCRWLSLPVPRAGCPCAGRGGEGMGRGSF